MSSELTVAQAAKRLGVAESRVRQMILDGTLPRARRLGKVLLLIPSEDVSKLKRKRKQNGSQRRAA